MSTQCFHLKTIVILRRGDSLDEESKLEILRFVSAFLNNLDEADYVTDFI